MDENKVILTDIKKTIKALPGDRRDAAESIYTEVVFLIGTLEKLKERIEKDGAVIKTARTVKENPAMRAYNSSLQRYSLLFKQLIDLLPVPAEKPKKDPLTAFVNKP